MVENSFVVKSTSPFMTAMMASFEPLKPNMGLMLSFILSFSIQ